MSAAIHDAVALANWISTLHIAKLADIDFIFAEYQAERLPVAKEAIKTIRLFKSSRGKVNSDNCQHMILSFVMGMHVCFT